jgi:hypothetical protein
MIDRRAFVAGVALVAITPALGVLPSGVAARGADVIQPVLMIDGWSQQDPSASENQLWMRVSRGWRTTWR